MDAARQLQQLVSEAKVIFVTMHAGRAFVTEAFRSGASGYLVKQSAASELIFAIRKSRMMKQFGLRTTAEVIKYAIAEGIVSI